MSNAKYYFHKHSINNPEGVSTFSNFRKSMGYLWDSSTALYRTDSLGNFIAFDGTADRFALVVPAGYAGSDGYVSSGEFVVRMEDTTEYEGSYVDDGGILRPIKSHKFLITADATQYASQEDFEAEMRAYFQESESYYDGTFACFEPESIKGLSSYNYFQEEYEDFSLGLSVNERSLPNAYFNYLYYVTNVDKPIIDDRIDYPDLFEHATLFDLVDPKGLEYLPEDSADLDVTLKTYYNDFANSFEDISVDKINKINKKNEKLVFDNKAYKDSWAYNFEMVPQNSWRHPFYGGVSFNRDFPEDYAGEGGTVAAGSSYAASLASRNLTFAFSSWVLSEASTRPVLYNLSSPEAHYTSFNDLFEVYRVSDASNETISFGHRNSILWAEDPELYSDPESGVTVPSFFSSEDTQGYHVYKPTATGVPLQNFYSVCPEDEELYIQNQLDGGYLREGNYNNFIDDIYSIEEGKTRGFSALFQQGELAYTETLGYRITKKDNDENGETIQQIYIANSLFDVPDNNISYVDTQVKFGKQYYYEVHEAKYVLGQEYQFSVESVATNRDAAPVITHVEFTFASPLGGTDEDSPSPSSRDPFMWDQGSAERVGGFNRWKHTDEIGLPERAYIYDADEDSSWGNYFPRMMNLGDEGGGIVAPFNTWACAGAGDLCVERVVQPRPGPVLFESGFSFVSLYDVLIGDLPDNAFIDPPNIAYLTVLDDLEILDYPNIGDSKDLEFSPVIEAGDVYGGVINIYRYRIPIRWLQTHNLALDDSNEPVLDPDKTYTSIAEVRAEFREYLNRFPDLFTEESGAWTNPSTVFVPESVIPFDMNAEYSEEEVVEGAGEVLSYNATVDLEIRPKSSIVLAPYGSATSKVSDKPPRKPDVNIVPYRSISDKILLNFTCAFGVSTEIPIAIESGDQGIIDSLPRDPADESQVIYATGQRIEDGHTTGYDDYPSYIEIYRTTTKPTSYQDFAGKLRKKLSTFFSEKPNVIRNLSPSLEDNLMPNTKYYYTFRCVDFHGTFSNPTSIYEVEMVDDGGSVYPLINSFRPESTATVDGTKSFKKLLLIRPNIQQSMLTTEDGGIKNEWGEALDGTTNTPDTLNTAKLGGGLYDENTLWGKKFKFRIRSTETGKKIDLNVNFKTKTEYE